MAQLHDYGYVDTAIANIREVCEKQAENIQKAAETAYHGVDAVRFEGMQYRHDIGYRAMK